MFSFAWPWMIVLAPLPFLVRWLFPAAPRTEGGDAPEIAFPYVNRLMSIFPSDASGISSQAFWYLAILTALWLCVIGALMRPQLMDQSTQVKSIGHDLMLAVDLSGSMHALDFSNGDERLNRLDVIKEVVGKFVRERKGDRIGLVLFGGNAYLRVPLTFDTLSVGKMLDNMQIGEAGDSTAIGDAIGLAVQNLRDRPAQSRVLVLLTDGADNASTIPPLQAAKLAAQYGIRIYTIGIGSHGPVPIPNEDGNIVMAQMDLDEDLLQKIADMTGGSYFHATQTSTLETIYDKINKLEATESEERTYLIRKPLYAYPLGAAMGMLLILTLTPLRRRVIHGV
jgi:Ca-activated chloride channel family protein